MFHDSKNMLGSGTRRLAGFALVFSVFGAQAGEVSLSSGPDSLTLEDALSRTLAQNLHLAAQNLEIQAREAQLHQAGAVPNPEFNLEAENFAGSRKLSGVDGLETTVGVGQVFELGGKRDARKRLAGSDKKLAEWDFKVAQLNLEAEIRSAFTDVLAAQEKLRILQKGLEINQQILETAKLRHQAGKAPATEEMKARMAYSLTHIDIDRAAQELRSARIKLAAYWSSDPPTFKGAIGDLGATPVLPPLEGLLPRLKSHPELARWDAEVAQHRFAEEAAKSERIPNLSLGAGIRHLNDGGNGDLALVAGVSMPLPLFNRNQGSIREMGHRLAKSEKEKQAVVTRLSARLRTLHESLLAKSEEIVHLKDELLPESKKTLQASREAYQLGKLSFLEVLDSQRTLFDLSTRFISILAEYHKDWNELQSLVRSGNSKND